MDWGEAAKILASFGAPGGVTVGSLLLLLLWVGSREKPPWVYGATHRAALQDRDEWKALALSAAGTVKEQAEQIARLTDLTETLIDASIGKARRR